MIRSLHMKLVMIIVLLILSLMTVVGAFLVNSVMAFYLDDFYTRMQSVFEQEALVSDLRTPNEGEESGGEALMSVLSAYSGQLGLDGRSRKLYILDGAGQYLTGSDGRSGEAPDYSPNLMAVLSGREEVGDDSSAAAGFSSTASAERFSNRSQSTSDKIPVPEHKSHIFPAFAVEGCSLT